MNLKMSGTSRIFLGVFVVVTLVSGPFITPRKGARKDGSSQQSNTRTASLEQRQGDGREVQRVNEARRHASSAGRVFECVAERVLLQQRRRLDVRIESREGEGPTGGVYLWEALPPSCSSRSRRDRSG
jgi:hypothetical protein